MFCHIYRSNKSTGAYLYLAEKERIDNLPKALIEQFGKPQLVMTLQLDKVKQLAMVDLEHVKYRLQQEGFYLQLPHAAGTPII